MTDGGDSSIASSIQPAASLALEGIYVEGGVAESAELAVLSGSRKIVSRPKTAFEELRIPPHEEIPKGTQRDLNVAAARRTLRVFRTKGGEEMKES